ncbi:6-phospho-beta-glucosidase [Escherichia coli]|nr:6-phospho-beta-glucosidase [Escherichia coli]
MVTEAVYRHTGFKRFIGVCNIPIGMKMFIRDVLMLKDSDDLSIDLFGLNHMVFIKVVLVNGKSRFAESVSYTTPLAQQNGLEIG